MSTIRSVSRWILGLFFIAAGFNHFHNPIAYLQIVPPSLPTPLLLIYFSGLAEIAGGVGVLIPMIRKAAGWGLILLLLAVFPANIYALQSGMIISGHHVPFWILLLRLPLQPVLIYWVYWTCIHNHSASKHD